MGNISAIRDFPQYMMNMETGEIIGKRYGKVLQPIIRQGVRTSMVQMRHNGRRIIVSKNKLMYAMKQGVSYFDIPQDFFIVKNGDGLRVMEKSELVEFANSAVRKMHQRDRLKRIDEKIQELEIMKRAYMEHSHVEAVQYIESRKEILINRYIKKYAVSYRNAEYIYCLALEKMVSRIDSPTSMVTELTLSMMYYMRKIKIQLNSEYHGKRRA